MRKYLYYLSILSVGICSVSISAPVLANINTNRLEPVTERKLERLIAETAFDTTEFERLQRKAIEEHRRKHAENFRNRPKSKRNYQGIAHQAILASDQCNRQKRQRGCEQLAQIQDTLSTWCSRNDRDACEVYRAIANYSMSEQSGQTILEIIGN